MSSWMINLFEGIGSNTGFAAEFRRAWVCSGHLSGSCLWEGWESTVPP